MDQVLSQWQAYRESTESRKEADAKRLLKKREGEISEGKVPGIYFDRVRFDELAALKRMLNLGAQRTPPKVDRVPYIPMLKENNVRKGFFKHGEFLALREALPFYLKGFVTFGYNTGWRVSEIENLTWNQVDLERRIVRLEVGETKNDDGRTIYLDDELNGLINQQWKMRKQSKVLTPCVFPNKDGNGKISDFRELWNKACIEAKIGKRAQFRAQSTISAPKKGLTKTANPLISFGAGGRNRTDMDISPEDFESHATV